MDLAKGRMVQPRLLISVFIGSRLTSLSDPDGEDTAHFWLNVLSIGASMVISTGTGVWIYKLTLRQMKKLEGRAGEEAVEALEEGFLNGYADQTGPELEEEEPLVPTQRSRPEGVVRRSSSMGDSH